MKFGRSLGRVVGFLCLSLGLGPFQEVVEETVKGQGQVVG